VGEQYWIVDYDLPEGYPRLKFYRAIRKWLTERNVETTGWSTQSVIITKDEEFAHFAYDTAVAVPNGRAHIYKGEMIR